MDRGGYRLLVRKLEGVSDGTRTRDRLDHNYAHGRDTGRAMSQENVEKVRRSFEAYCRGDYARGSEWLARDVTWENGQEAPRERTGREMWKRWDSEWEELETFAEEFIDAGDHVVMVVRYRWPRSGQRGRGD